MAGFVMRRRANERRLREPRSKNPNYGDDALNCTLRERRWI
jgi:hypothetical protein